MTVVLAVLAVLYVLAGIYVGYRTWILGRRFSPNPLIYVWYGCVWPFVLWEIHRYHHQYEQRQDNWEQEAAEWEAEHQGICDFCCEIDCICDDHIFCPEDCECCQATAECCENENEGDVSEEHY